MTCHLLKGGQVGLAALGSLPERRMKKKIKKQKVKNETKKRKNKRTEHEKITKKMFI